MKKVILLAFLTIGFFVNSYAQSSASATATATIITPISLTKNLDMNFGNLALNPTSPGGDVTLPASATPTRTADPGVTLPAVTGTVQAAKFTVTGEGASVYTITLPASITLTGTGTNMIIVPNCSESDLTAGTLTAGSQVFYVGGVLTVAAVQTAGVYSGTFNVSVNYN
ncbi:MAG: DUF4402 domain-containing protein [Flavobacterium sp.]|nr:DUF4402 domain-containing protein [Pedobacter sp.]